MNSCISNITSTIQDCPETTTDSNVSFVPDWLTFNRLFFMVLVVILGVPGNGVIILVQFKNRRKSSTDCLIIAMAVCDLVLAGFVGSVGALESVPKIWVNIVSDITCKLYFYVIYCATFASTQLLAAVAFDRFRHTCRPLSKMFDAKIAVKLNIFVAINSMLICSLIFVRARLNVDSYTCGLCEDCITEGMIFDVAISTSFLVMFVVVIVCYSKVAHTLRTNYKNKIKCQQQDSDITEEKSTTSRWKNTFKMSVFRNVNRVGVIQSDVSNTSITYDGKTLEGVETQGHRFSVITDKSKRNDSQVQLGKSCGRNSNTISKIVENSSGNASEMSTKITVINIADSSIRNPGIDISKNTASTSQMNPTTNGPIRPNKKQVKSKLTVEYQRVNRTTKMMFLITATYVMSWVIQWCSGIYLSIGENRNSVTGGVLSSLFGMSFMVNCISNPAFYISLSSVFRERVRALFCRR